ncbi:mannitol dehydrogenase family protein [Aliiruegeria sabulilitoris]|uniref:mannitol dehydrogenase family protein n=1 Tax=Aliiruegeria sabulilitoris TaxID=1510458 RepID=UPI00082AD190|nr:mannitol dehydrogenase family protein [Aliiruegeria sabulilitoris]NDR57364.1 mannitol dehydrogenase family protein [Pseudoruegeria sp. M32A2M]
MKLSEETLDDLHPEISRPAYDRSKVTPGILHVGLGNFHRAHQAVYIDDLLAKGGADEWGILGAGVMPADAQMRDGLKAQDCLYTVLEQDASGDKGRVIGAMTDFAPVDANHAGILQAMASPSIRIVSLTVTEGGYFVSAETGGFNPDHPTIQADIANPGKPGTIFGAIVGGLRARREAGMVPFTVMSCDNVPHNGEVTRAAVLGIARGQDAALADWIDQNVAFPNGMVDRITPATTEARVNHLREAFGLEDARPVFCEPFRQWVLEDKFTDGRPALEEVGVQFVPDVTPYEHMKIRILNGGHAMIAYPGALLGLTYAHDAMAHPLVRGFLEKVETTEVIPIVPPVPDTSLTAYFKLIEERFANPRVEDTLSRLCLDGSNRQPKFIVPSAADCLKAGRSVDGLALASALWCRYCFGEGEHHEEIPPNDPSWDRLRDTSRVARDNPIAWLQMSDIYGDVGQSPIFQEAFAKALRALWDNGTEATLQAYLND